MVITGIVIAIVAIIEMGVYSKSSHRSYWPVINIIAGVWLFISTSFASGNTTMIWSNIVLGVTTIVTALVALSYESAHSSAVRPTH